MSTFKLEVRYCMNNSDINVVGEMLGYDWNDVCDYIGELELYGEGCDGSYEVSRGTKFNHEEIDAIFEKIFNDNPEANKICIINE